MSESPWKKKPGVACFDKVFGWITKKNPGVIARRISEEIPNNYFRKKGNGIIPGGVLS